MALPGEITLRESARIPRDGWLAIACGVGLAVVTQIVPALQVMIGYFLVLVHEMGHAAAGWLFGYPSIPAFDFRYGGGVTAHQSQMTILIVLVFAAIAWLGWMLRRNAAGLVGALMLAALYGYAVATPWHEVVMISMGHGFELIFAALFLSRALSGRACTYEVERPLYAWIGFFIVIQDVRFAHGLISDPSARLAYQSAKGGGHWMDFSRLSIDYFDTNLETVAWVFLLLCFLPPVIGFAVHRYRPHLRALAERGLRIE